MKKILIALTLVLSCLGISKVNAESLHFEDFTDKSFNKVKEIVGTDNFNTIIDDIISKYKNTYINSYPYYYISIVNNVSPEAVSYSDLTLDIYLNASVSVPSFLWSWAISGDVVLTRFKNTEFFIRRHYPIMSDNQNVFDLSNYTETISSSTDDSGWYQQLFSISNHNGFYATYRPYVYYLSNFDLYLPSLPSEFRSYDYIKDYDSFGIPLLDGSNLSTIVSFDKEDYLIEPYYLYDSDVNLSIPNIEEINLNDYAYVAFALKDYSKYNYSTTIQVKGQYCPTPVYGMGLESSEDLLNKRVSDVCTPYYDNYTPVRLNLYESDVKNYPIYYVKAYDTTRDNYIKVDTSIFDITYVTEVEKDNPYVFVQGNYYPTIPFDRLPSNSIQNTEEGYIFDGSDGFKDIKDFADLFATPLDFLRDIWSAIVSFFSLITNFISLLPVTLQGFLYASFTLAVVLGLIKIIL